MDSQNIGENSEDAADREENGKPKTRLTTSARFVSELDQKGGNWGSGGLSQNVRSSDVSEAFDTRGPCEELDNLKRGVTEC